jgi:hypothetical protein
LVEEIVQRTKSVVTKQRLQLQLLLKLRRVQVIMAVFQLTSNPISAQVHWAEWIVLIHIYAAASRPKKLNHAIHLKNALYQLLQDQCAEETA